MVSSNQLKENVENQISTNATKEDEVNLSLGEPSTLISKPHKQDKKTSLTNTNKLEGFMDQVMTNIKELVTTFQVTLVLFKNMDAHMAT